MDAALLIFPFLIGALISMQGPINGALKVSVGSTPMFAAFISLLGGTVLTAVASVLLGDKWSSVTRLTMVPAWQLAGGLLGAVFVFGMATLAPRVGVANMMSLIIAGQIAGSLMFDRLGAAGLVVREVSAPRLAGATLVVVGALLVNFGNLLKGS